MKVFIVATIALMGVSVCAAGALPSQYLPPNHAAAASQPSHQYVAQHAAAGGHAHYHGVDGGAHYQSAPVHHAPAHGHAGAAAASAASARYISGGHHGGAQIPILRSDYTNDASSGSYNFGFETGNGIRRDESGSFVGGWPHGSQSVKGSYSYTGDDGHVYTVNYTADENGFHPEGDHLPTNSPAHAGGHGGHGHGFPAASGQYQHAASAHAPSAQYLPPQKLQQSAGYNYARHGSH